jgi:hypothetical protein
MLNKIVFIISVLFIIVACFFGYLYLTQKDATSGVNEVVSTVRNLFPFGQGTNTPTNTSNEDVGVGDNTKPTQTESKQPPTLRQIFSSPISGAQSFLTGSSTVIRFVEKSTGNIFEAKTEVDSIERISNTTIPKTTEAIFVKKDSVLMRYLKDDSDLIETILGSFATNTPSTNSENKDLAELKITYLTPNIRDLALSPKKDRLFYITQSGSGVVGILSSPEDTNKTQITSSPLREWNISWPNTNTVTITTKASGGIPGYLYFINTTTGKMSIILNEITGLTTLTNSTASTTIYNQVDASGNVTLKAIDIKTGISKNIPEKTFTEKCVWSKKDANIIYCAIPSKIPSKSYPDAWYKGLVSFSDSLWKINASTGQTNLIVDIKDVSGADLDVVNIFLDEEEEFLIFTNKKDLTLWSFDLQ